MQKKINWLAVFATIMTILFVVVGCVALFKAPTEVVPEGYLSPSEISVKVNEEVGVATAEMNSEIASLNNKIVELENQTSTETETEGEVVLDGYLIDELYLSLLLDEEVLSDRT